MTSKERLFSVLAGKQPDRIPNLNIIMQYAAREIGVPYSVYCKQHEKLVEGNIVCAEKYGLDCVTTMSDPMKELEAAIEAGRFHHDGNPIMTWCIANVIGKNLPGNDDVVRPIKQGDDNKIDGAVALIMAIGRAMAGNENPDLSDFFNNAVIG